MVASSNDSSPVSTTLFNKHLSQPETSSSSLSTSSSSLNTQSNPPRESIDLKVTPSNNNGKKGQSATFASTSTAPPPQRESEVESNNNNEEEEKTCLDMYMQSPCSGIWMYDAGDKLDKIHPILSIPFYILCCPFAMPCIFTSGCLMMVNGSSEDDDIDATPYALKKKQEENSKEEQVQ